MFAYNLLSGLFRAIENSFMPLAFLIISSVINIVLDVLFITQFQMGIRGAAVGNGGSTGNFCSIMCYLYYEKCEDF